MTTTPKVAMIWAQAQNGVIGVDGGMPWFVPEDFAHFKTQTMGSPVIMGRTTWDSLPAKSRPLPGRDNIVITANSQLSVPAATLVHNVEDALRLANDLAGTRDSSKIWIIGGASIYKQFMPYAHYLEVTDINLEVVGDTRAPNIGDEYKIVSRVPESGWLTSRTGIEYAFTTYEREGDTER